ncbi:uncharacterized protein LOC121794754 [Salvia splendens]|uniref:uncharacterized protein LOC121794754 n=1 Tax=Salvia splendens TaxID=180675 RepID=UPI001C262BA1|nr:uncharacterized protein LOC121794754 [Salvia splendens]
MSMPPLGSQNDKDKKKASNFPISTFTVGNWKRETTRKGDLTAKIYYAKKKLLWEFLNGPLKIKMEVCWSDITAIEAVINPNQPGFLRIELAKPPLFFREIPPQPKKHSNWEPVDDFTGGQAQLCMRHEATFPPGVLDKHYEKLLVHDERLAVLSRRLFQTHESVLPLQQIPQQQQLHNSLHIAASARGNQINNDPTCVGSSSRNPIVVSDQQQQLHHSLYKAPSASSNGGMAAWGNQINNKPTFVGSSSQNPLVINNEPTFTGSSSYNNSLVINNEPRFMGSSSIVRDQRLNQYNDMAFNNQQTKASSSQNPFAVPASTFVGSSRQNRPLVIRDQRGYQYNDMTVNNIQPTFVGASSQNPVALPASTFVHSSRQNHPLVIRDQRGYQYNDMTVNNIQPTFVGSSSQNPVALPGSTFVHSSRQNRPLVIRDQPLCQYNDLAVNNEPAFVDRSSSGNNSSAVSDEQQLSPRSRCLPWCMRRGNDKGKHMVQNAPTDDQLGLAEAILREANANCDDGAWSLLDLYIKQSQEDHCNQPVGGGNVNEASSTYPAPPSKP